MAVMEVSVACACALKDDAVQEDIHMSKGGYAAPVYLQHGASMMLECLLCLVTGQTELNTQAMGSRVTGQSVNVIFQAHVGPAHVSGRATDTAQHMLSQLRKLADVILSPLKPWSVACMRVIRRQVAQAQRSQVAHYCPNVLRPAYEDVPGIHPAVAEVATSLQCWSHTQAPSSLQPVQAATIAACIMQGAKSAPQTFMKDNNIKAWSGASGSCNTVFSSAGGLKISGMQTRQIRTLTNEPRHYGVFWKRIPLPRRPADDNQR